MNERKVPSCGALLRQVRKRHRLGQGALAARAGTTQAQISRIERDAISPSLATLERMLGAVGETLSLGSLSLDQPPPGGGNTTIRELRADYQLMSAAERLEQAAELSRMQTELGAGKKLQ